MSKHTQGPWIADAYTDGSFTIMAEQTLPLVIAQRGPHRSRADEMCANARLLASAPEMLAHLKIVVFHLRRGDHVGEHGSRCTNEIIVALEAAIKKAQP